MKKKFRSYWLLIVLLLALTLSVTACGKKDPFTRVDEVYGVTRLSAKELGRLERTIPETADGGLEAYPVYGKNFAGDTAKKQAVLDENAAIYAYDAMDADGTLYKDGQPTGKKLFRHTAAVSNYGETIDDAAFAVVERLRLRPRRHGNVLTGLYAAPGEVVTIVLDEETAARRYQVEIGHGTQRGGGINIPVKKNFTRMPMLKKSLVLDKTVNYVGSPLGGPIYINIERGTGNKFAEFEMTVSGALEMPHYVLGATTDEQWETLKSAPGTVFDLETERGVRLTMPAHIVRKKSAEEIRAAAEFWDKAAQLGHKFGNSGVANPNNADTCLISMVFDNYVPAGAAVAFVGADFCVLPTGWGANAINAEQLILSGGWGSLHEMNHHHQGWGAGNNGEVTNNTINALTYMLYTNIASARTESGGLDGWNWVSDAYYSLKNAVTIQKQDKKNQTLSMYTVLQHAFGPDAFIKMANASRQNNETAWFNAVVDATGYDMTFYLKDVCKLEIDPAAIEAVKQRSLPMFVPSACLYQTGYVYEAGAVEMGKPFYIPVGKEKALDFSSAIVVPDGVGVRILSVTDPAYGRIEKTGEYTYTYQPGKSKDADTFEVRAELTVEATGYVTETTYKLAFAQDGAGIDAAVYDSRGYADIGAALSAGVDKATPVLERSWSYAGFSIDKNYAQSLTVAEGKLLFPEAGTYRLFVKGDDQAEVYAGTEQDALQKVAAFFKYTPNYSRDADGTKFDATVSQGQALYFKAYVLNTGGSGSFNIGIEDLSQIEGGTPVEEDGNVEDSTAQLAPIVNVPAAYVYKTQADPESMKRGDFTSKKLFGYTVKAEDARVLDSQTGMRVVKTSRLYGSLDPQLAVDGDSNTTVHTQPGALPAEFVFDLGETRRFNMVRFSANAASQSRGRIKDYKLYAGDALDALAPVSEGTLPSAFTSEIHFPVMQARYIRIEATDVYPGNTGEKYVAFSDFFTGNVMPAADIAPQNGSDVLYKGDWSLDTFGTSMQGLAVSSKGRAEVNFHGTGFALYAKKGRAFGKAELRLDGGEWTEIDFYADRDAYRQLIYLAADLDDGFHKVEIRTRKDQAMNIDYFAVKPTTPPPDTGLGLWWILIVFAIVVAAAAVGVGAFFGTAWLMKRKESEKKDKASGRKNGTADEKKGGRQTEALSQAADQTGPKAAAAKTGTGPRTAPTVTKTKTRTTTGPKTDPGRSGATKAARETTRPSTKNTAETDPTAKANGSKQAPASKTTAAQTKTGSRGSAAKGGKK